MMIVTEGFHQQMRKTDKDAKDKLVASFMQAYGWPAEKAEEVVNFMINLPAVFDT